MGPRRPQDPPERLKMTPKRAPRGHISAFMFVLAKAKTKTKAKIRTDKKYHYEANKQAYAFIDRDTRKPPEAVSYTHLTLPTKA